MNMRFISIAFAFLFLTACGTTPEERGISGAGIGAGAGAIVGAVTGLTVVQGAVLGAVGGGLTGAMTDRDDIDLGEPAWKQSNNQGVKSNTVMEVQKGLAEHGYDPGPVDGKYGEQTRNAIRQYQKDHGLPVDGQATTALVRHINQQQS